MPVRISAKNTKVSDRLQEHIDKACEKLHQFYDGIIDCEVVVEKRKKHGTAVEVLVRVPHQTLVGKAESDDDNLYKSIDEACDRVGTQLKKYHDKQVTHR